MAGVIDQDIDCAEALLGGAHHRTPPGVVGNIERERGTGMRPGEILDPGRIPSRHDDVMSLRAVRGDW
jgi:hypothetical protein